MSAAACFIAGGMAPGAALEALISKEPVSLSAVDFVCCDQSSQISVSGVEKKYKVALVASCSALGREALARVARSLEPGARLYVYEATGDAAAASRSEALKKDLLLSGFTGAEELSSSGTSAVAAPVVWLTAQLPAWGLGASAKLSLKRAAPAAAAPAPAAAPAQPAAAAVWKLGGDEDEGDEELVDEEALLTEEDRAAAAAPKQDDCEVGAGRKACKNCSCGRAEMEAGQAAAPVTQEMLDNPTSACGSCYLGDAFRCGGCPYRGMPAFAPGQKITLGAGLLTADV